MCCVSVSYLHVSVLKKAKATATVKWRQMGVRSVHEALGIYATCKYTHRSERRACTARRWGSFFWRSWARVIRGRLPVIGRPNADILHHGPPPAYAHGREAVGGAEAWPQVHPGVVRGARAAAGRHQGEYRLSRPCSG